MPLLAGQQGSANGTITYSYTDTTAPAGEPQKSRFVKLIADFAYTLNHAIVCTITDPFTDLLFGVVGEETMEKIRGYHPDGKITREGLKQGLHPATLWSTMRTAVGNITKSIRNRRFLSEMGENFSSPQKARNWLVGEVTGDFGAVPVVVAIQNFAPWIGDGIRKILSPIAKPIFRHSAERSARREFERQGLEAKGPEFEQRVEDFYLREMEHLPKAALWTLASPAINITMQKLVMKSDSSAVDLGIVKLVGATVTSGITLGLRSLAPDNAQKWDDWVSRKASGPIAGAISTVFGIDKDELKKEMQEREDHEHGRKPHGKAFPKEKTMEEKYGKKASDRINVAWAHRVENEEKEKTKSQYGLAS